MAEMAKISKSEGGEENWRHHRYLSLKASGEIRQRRRESVKLAMATAAKSENGGVSMAMATSAWKMTADENMAVITSNSGVESENNINPAGVARKTNGKAK